MKKRNVMLWTLLLFCYVGAAAQRGLKDVLGNYFLMGAALNTQQTGVGCDSAVTAVICQHFNSIVAENCMKPEELQPQEGTFKWRKADRFVAYGEKHGMTVTGHVLVWHAQTPDWFFKDSLGHEASKELLTERMRRHIHAVVGRYKGRIKGWDVVNEAIEDDGSYRQSPWYRILGPEYIEMAFSFAHEADPDAELYYNDYSMSNPEKREKVCQIVHDLKAKGLRIDAVGMQSHNGLTAEAERRINDRWLTFFRIYKRHAHQISRITLWGVSDRQSWMNDWPIQGRTAYPLLFDRQYQPKPVVNDIIGLYR